MSLVHPMFTSLLISSRSRRHTPRFESQKDLLVSHVGIIPLLLPLSVKLNPTARFMLVTVLVPVVAVLVMLVTVLLPWPDIGDLVTGL